MTFLKQQLLLILFILPTFLLGQDSAQYNLLWRIEGNDLQQPSYLFGTMHVNDARAFNFSDSVMLALERCETFAMEVHPDTMMNSMFQELFNSSKEKNFKDILSAEEYQQLKQKFEEKSTLDLDKINIQNPSILSSMMEPDEDKVDDKATFVDAYLFGIARTLNKSIWGLESMKDHSDAFSNYNKEQQRAFLLGLINDNYEADYQEMLDALVDVYKEGNIIKIGTMANVFTAIDSQLIRRNFVMVNSMERLMQEQSLFAAVGTAHLPGQNGIISILAERGYRVSPVSATFTGVAEKYAIDYDKMSWHTQIDSSLGFAIDFPGEPTQIDLFNNLNTLMYVDLTNEVFLAAYSVDMRDGKTQNKEEIIENAIDNYINQSDYRLLEKTEVSLNGIDRTDIIIAQDSSKQLRIQFMYVNDILYYFMIGNDAQQIRGSYAKRYYESLHLFKPSSKVDTGWYFNYLAKAAVSIAFPSKPSYQIDNSPSEDNNPSYIYHNYTANDFGLMTAYAFRYFDQPIGYARVNNKDQVFHLISKNFQGLDITIRKTDTILQDGIQGRVYDLLLENKYYIRCKVYLRGARTYYLFHQNLNEGDSTIREDAFLKSFSFVNYQTPEWTPFVAKDSSFSIDFFDEPRINKDTSNDYYLHATSYYSVNPNSGMLCNLQVAKVSNYLKIDHLDSFYQSIPSLDYGDSLISTKEIQIGNCVGKESIIQQHYQDRILRQRIWLDAQKLYLAKVYIDDDSIYNSSANQYLNSFQQIKKTSNFDPFQDKDQQLLRDLQSKDSLTRYQANNALDFYNFDSSNVKDILAAVQLKYPKDSLTTAYLIYNLQGIANPSILPTLIDLYQQESTNTATRIAILRTIPVIDTIKGIATYLDLLQLPSFISDQYDYTVFNIFYQYPEQFKANYERILALAKYDSYRYYIISFSAHLVRVDSVFADDAAQYLPTWLPYFNVDLENYDAPSKRFWENNSPLLSEYLRFFSISKDKQLLGDLTAQLLDQAVSPHLKAQVLSIRLQAGLSPHWSKKEFHQYIKKPSYRPYLLPILFEYNYQNLIPRSFKYAPKVAKHLFYDYIRDEDSIDFVKELGKLKTAEGTYYVYEYRFLEEETSFIGIAGPFTIGKPIMDYNYYSITYAEMIPFSKNWKKDGLLLIENFKEHKYYVD
jgi:uncharacterized protein YbaP (TraB family)